tara:strand:- start:14 stop:841 length:828 start_codon:yes stop_codon:yes gene_type:complete
MKKDKYYILFLGACVLSAMFTFLLTMTINSIDVPQSPNQQGLRHGYVNPVVSPPPVPPPSPPSSPPPCILIRSATTPSFRLCTLDPELDKWSLLARTTAPSLLVHWPLKALLKTIDSRPFVVDAIANIGYFAFEAASLGASVLALSNDVSLVQLMEISNTLNHNISINIFEGNGCDNPVHDLLHRIDILHIDAKDILSCATQLSKGIRYVYMRFAPTKLKNPIQLLEQMNDVYHMNIFEDSTASNGALEKVDFKSLIKGIGEGTTTLFLAHNNFM